MPPEKLTGMPDRESFVNRRRYLRLLGLAAGATAFAPTARAATQVHLGKEGLSDGDLVDPYLEEHWRNGNEVLLPAGTYKWDGGGLGITGGDAVLRSVGGAAVLERQADVIDVDIRATSGTIELRDLVIRGAAGEDGRIRSEAERGATVRHVNVRQPDGTDGDSEGTAFYTPRDHAGLVEYRGCEARGWGNNGIYASSPGKSDGGQGAVRVIGGYFENNNIASVRLGSPMSVVRDAVIVNDGQAPSRLESGRRQRGIRIRDKGDDIRVKNCHVTHTYTGDGSGEPFVVHDGAVGGSATVNGLYVRNDDDTEAIHLKDGSYDLTGKHVVLKGSGNLGHDGELTDVCVGGNCRRIRTKRIPLRNG